MFTVLLVTVLLRFLGLALLSYCLWVQVAVVVKTLLPIRLLVAVVAVRFCRFRRRSFPLVL
jgi:hypothetical protein